MKEKIQNMTHSAIADEVNLAFSEQSRLDAAGYRELMRHLEGRFFPKYTFRYEEADLNKSAEELIDLFCDAADKTYAAKEAEISSNIMRELERVIMLRVVDEYWMDHIDAMDDLKQGIRLRAYAQSDPVVAYKQESLNMFEEMIAAIQGETVRRLFSVQLRKDQEVKRERVAKGMVEGVGGDGSRPKRQPRKVVKIGRNDPCPCGSGKKYKVCCGRDA